MTDNLRWWTKHHHADRRPVLLSRMKIKSSLRAWFETAEFQEVEAGCLQVSPGNERHLHAFKTERVGTDLSGAPFYLHTSPEFACKKLLAAGEKQIFSFAHVFRNREAGPLHANEFTMLEWYRTGQSTYETVIADGLQILQIAARAVGRQITNWKYGSCDLMAEAERLTVAEAFARYAGFDLTPTLGASPNTCTPNRDLLADHARTAGIASEETDTWSDIFSRVLTALIEPKLGQDRPTVLIDYPAPEAALARSKPTDKRFAKRFEIYVCGVELANGFGELTDPIEQRARFNAEMDAKEKLYGERYPIDEDFLDALAHMPQASGVALGFDRLVMLATGAQRIDQVIWTPMPASD